MSEQPVVKALRPTGSPVLRRDDDPRPEMVGQFPRGVARLLTGLRLGWSKTFRYPTSDP